MKTLPVDIRVQRWPADIAKQGYIKGMRIPRGSTIWIVHNGIAYYTVWKTDVLEYAEFDCKQHSLVSERDQLMGTMPSTHTLRALTNKQYVQHKVENIDTAIK